MLFRKVPSLSNMQLKCLLWPQWLGSSFFLVLTTTSLSGCTTLRVFIRSSNGDYLLEPSGPGIIVFFVIHLGSSYPSSFSMSKFFPWVRIESYCLGVHPNNFIFTYSPTKKNLFPKMAILIRASTNGANQTTVKETA